MYFKLGIHQVSTKISFQTTIFSQVFYFIVHSTTIVTFKFYSNFTKIDLVQSTKVKVQNTVKTFHDFKIAESTVSCSKVRISVSLPQQQEKSE